MPPPRTGLRQWWDDPELIGHASTMMGTGVHVVDALRFVLDQEVVEVAAISDGQTPSHPLEQLVAMTLRFDRGTIATVCCGRRLPDSRNDLVVYGSLGRLIGSDALWEGRQGTFNVVSGTMQQTETYPDQPLANFIDELDDFHRAINVVEPTTNRVSADEVTYNLHVLVRYELEITMLAGDLDVSDLPGAWNERAEHYLGVVPRSAGVRVVRDGKVVHEGRIASLKRFKDDASEVRAGFDCGIGLERFQDVKPGDVIEAFVKEEVAPVLA